MIKKLLALALNPSAEEGEWQNAAVMCVRQLRKDGVKPEDIRIGKQTSGNPLLDALFGVGGVSFTRTERQRRAYTPSPPPPPTKFPSKMPFGKYKGYLVTDLPMEYLNWLSTWFKSVNGFEELKQEVDNEIMFRFNTQ